MNIEKINENLVKIHSLLLFLLPKKIKFVNELIGRFKNFFSDEEVLELLKDDADYEKALDPFIEESSKLVGKLDELNSFLKEENIEDKNIFTLINGIKVNIMDVLITLKKKERNKEIALQQKILDKIKELILRLSDVESRRKKEEEKEYIIEASSYFRKQRGKTKDFKESEISDNIEKIKLFANANKISSRPQFAEPHCYGGAPHHLNSVVMGKTCRLVFYMQPNEKSNTIRICLYVPEGMHNRAWDVLQTNKVLESNLYWRITTKLKKYKILRTYFTDFKRINPENLADL